MSRRLTLIPIAAVAALFGVCAGTALGAEHTVKMLNDNGKGEYMVFEPDFIQAEPGDTIKTRGGRPIP